ncbi:MAG: type I methionyl aminopeptidase [Chloroflexi bacterium]|nr:type I methionyl aminopeptidase [Chloroflexota bacterium]
MTVNSEKDLMGLLRIGRVVGMTLQKMRAALRPGITTAELDHIGAEYLRQHGARSAPILTYNFPGATCISLNNEAAHGIPGSRVIQIGDLVNIDVSAELDGYYADTGASFPMPPVKPEYQRLLDHTRAALDVAIAAARAGEKLNNIGRAVETFARKGGYKVIQDLPGHGVGRKLHEPPTVPNFYVPTLKTRLTEGMVITLEPFLSMSANRVVQQPDGWTLKTEDGSMAAQYEHTVIITRGRPLLTTLVS